MNRMNSKLINITMLAYKLINNILRLNLNYFSFPISDSNCLLIHLAWLSSSHFLLLSLISHWTNHILPYRYCWILTMMFIRKPIWKLTKFWMYHLFNIKSSLCRSLHKYQPILFCKPLSFFCWNLSSGV